MTSTEQPPEAEPSRSISDSDLTILRAKYPGYAAFKVSAGDQVQTDTVCHGWVVIDAFAEDEVLVVVDEVKISKSLSPHRLAIDSTLTQSNYTGENSWNNNSNNNDKGIRRHLVIRRQRFLLGQTKGTVIARLTEQAAADKRKIEQADTDRGAAAAALRKSDEERGAAERKFEKEHEERNRQQLSLDQLNADLRGSNSEIATLRAQVKKLKEHIGQREFDKLFAEGTTKK